MPRRSLAAALLLLALPVAARAQERTCDLVESGNIERRVEGGLPMLYLLDPFYVRCQDGAELRARSGVINQLMRQVTLNGDVFFQDPDQTLTASEAVYHAGIARLEARGDVVFTNRQEGSELRGPELEYFRETEDRPRAQVNARGRPHLTLRPATDGGAAEPLEIDADRVVIIGQNDLTAYGSVVIERPDLDATADEARYLGEEENLELRGTARIRTEEYGLSAEVIQARLREGDLEHLRAVTGASLTGERLSLRAPELQLFFEGERLQRTIARVRGGEGERSVAVTRGFRLEADSLDALLPGQRLEQVVAIGSARGETVDTLAAAAPDTGAAAPADSAVAAADSVPADSAALAATALAMVDHDWIAGDTVIGYFETDSAAPAPAEPGQPADTANAVLRRLVASGDAQSLYRVVPQDEEPAPSGTRQGINFLAGDTIELTFAAGELDLAEVTGLQRGLYLDPLPPPAEEAPEADDAPPDAGGGTDEPALGRER